MTRQEFQRREKAWRRTDLVEGLALLALFVANVPISGLLNRLDNLWISVPYYVTFFGVMIGGIPLIYWRQLRRLRKLGLACPFCNTPFNNSVRPVVLATGNCVSCGKSLFDADSESLEFGGDDRISSLRGDRNPQQ
jgi:hypothetical protein